MDLGLLRGRRFRLVMINRLCSASFLLSRNRGTSRLSQTWQVESGWKESDTL
jgi:hypothetical protein